ncbi:MAG: tRNA epoxyqueuosine(34) reductase QueG [Duncaniella sp.]|nr:tRNA epoxyqueuosine(34) reductase QueG [Duncaniella sp.]
MNLTDCPCDHVSFLSPLLEEAGAARWGISEATDVAPEAAQQYLDFISSGRHASMEYLARNLEARFTTSLILPGARSIISVAFTYPEAPEPLTARHPRWAAYCLGDDYHEVIRRRLAPVAAEIDNRLGAVSRVCVDTAPIMERYRAVRAGVGFRGRNGMLIVPGIGARVFLAEIFTTAVFPPSLPSPSEIACDGCGRCVAACPAGALCGDGTLDARRCLSYLTIEHRGALPPGTSAGNRVYGCDTCRLVCPHENSSACHSVDEFSPRESILSLTVDDIAGMTRSDFTLIFRHSAIRRTKHEGLLRNVKSMLNMDGD